jgi:hypothetical protein
MSNIPQDDWNEIRLNPVVQRAEEAIRVAVFFSENPVEWILSQDATLLTARLSAARVQALITIRKARRKEVE